MAKDAIGALRDILVTNWSKPPEPSIEDIADLDKGDAKRVRMLDNDVIRIFETAHNEAQPELIYDYVNEHVNITIDCRTVDSRERLSEMRDEVRRIIHAFRKGDNNNFDRLIYKTRTDLSDRSKKLFRYTLQCEIITFSLLATAVDPVVNPADGSVSGANTYQTYDGDLTTLAQMTPSDSVFIVGNGVNWVAESGATARTSLGLGTIATQDSDDVSITGGSINGVAIGTSTTGVVYSITANTGITANQAAGAVTLNVGGLTVSELAANSLQVSSESFADNDTSLMTSAAIQDKILSYGYAVLADITSGVDLTAGTGMLIQSETNTASGDYSATITIDLKDEDNMASDSATHAASQQSIKAYVDNEVTSLIDSAPGALDTLNELAAAINDDASYFSTINTALGNRIRADASQSFTTTQKAQARTNIGLNAGSVPTAGTGIDISGSGEFSVDVSDFMSSGVNNYLLTATGADTFQGESTLTYDGQTLRIDNGSGEQITIGAGHSTGYQSIEIGGDTGAYIDLKSPNTDDYDIRIITTGNGGEILTASPLTFKTSNNNDDITFSPHGSGKVKIGSGGTEFTFPTARGTSGQVLKTGSNGVIAWGTDDNDNHTYAISSATVTGGANLVLTAGGSGSGTDTVKLAGGTNTTVSQESDVITIVSSDTTYSTNSSTSGSDARINLVAGGSGSGTDYVTIAGGSNVQIAETGDTITISSTTATTYDLLVAQTGGDNNDPVLRLDPSTGSNDDITITGGSNVTVTRNSGTQLTIASTDTNTQNVFATSFVDSSNDALLRLTKSGASSGTQDVKFVAGANITLTPNTGTSPQQLTIAGVPSANDATITLTAGTGLSGGGNFTTDQAGNETLTFNVDTGTIATRTYVDGLKQGLDTKDSVRVATTANITLSGTQTIDGVSVQANDRVLVKDQSTGSENGIYVASASSWARATDANADADVTAGLYVWVEEGTASGDQGWILTTNDDITVGSTALTFAQFSGTGQITAGTGMTKSGNTLNVGSLTVSEFAGQAIQTSSEVSSFGNNDTSLLTAAGIKNYIEANSFGFLQSVAVANIAGSAIQTGSESFADNDTTIMTSAAVQDKILSYGYTTNTGDITGVDLTVTSPITIASETNTGSGSYSATLGLADPATLTQLTESTDATDDKIILWDESASSWKYMTIDDLQDSIDTGGAGGIAFDGSTANGILTYKDADEASVESTLTYDPAGLLAIYPASGYGRIEMGGSSGAYIDLKNNSSDDFDVRLITDGTGLDIVASGAGNHITLKTNGTQRVKVEDAQTFLNTTSAKVGYTGQAGYLYLSADAAGSYLGWNTDGSDVTLRADDDLILRADDDMLFKNGSTTNMVLTSDARLGIGTTSPETTLHVDNGSIQVGLQADDYYSLLANNALAFHRAGASYIDQRIDNGDIRFRMNAASDDLMMLDGSTMRVGIGTTSPAVPFHVAGGNNEAARFEGSANDAFIKILEPTGSESVVLGSTSGTGFVGSATNNNFAIRANNSNKMTITPAGNVGIGTTSPDTVLNVISGTNDEEVLKIGNTAGNSGSTAGITHLGISHWDSGTHSSTRITATEDAAGSYLGSLSFGTRSAASDSAPAERMRITSAGNVGIGTTSPAGKLGVQLADATSNGNVSNWDNTYALFGDASAVGGEAVGIGFGTFGGVLVSLDPGSAWEPMNYMAGAHYFKENNTVVMTIDNFKVGIGTTAPEALLDVNTGAGIAIQMGADVNAATLTDDTRKYGRFATPHYHNAEEPIGLVVGDSDGTDNIVNIGGGSNAVNAATSIRFWSAANDATVTGTERMRITSAGDLAIGNLGTAGYKLDVQSGTMDSIARFKSSDANGRILIQDNDDTIYVGATSGYAYIGGTQNLGGGANLIVHKTTGNVGIGTTSPSGRLHVETTNTYQNGISDATAYFKAINTQSSAGYPVTLVLDSDHTGGGTGNDDVRTRYLNAGVQKWQQNVGSSLVWFYDTSGDNSGSWTERMTFTNAGALSIDSNMTVGGDLTVTGNDIKSSGGTTALTLSGANVTVAGDLTVSGTTTTINTTNLAVEDNIVVLNSNVTGTPADVDAGIEVERGDTANATLLFDEGDNCWKSYTPDSGVSFQARNSNGYISFGPQNGTYAHISTDVSKFYLNKQIVVDSGVVSSYNEDLTLQRAMSSQEQITIADDSMTFKSANTDVMKIDGANTRVGIGTTSPGFTLDVTGTFQAQGDHDDNVIIDNTGTDQVILASHTGSGTPVPWDIREASSTINNGANYGPLNITRMNMDADGAGSNIHFRTKKNNGSAQEVGGIGATIDTGLTASATITGSLHFYTTDAGSTRQEKMTIKSTGNVGIGTNAPATKLHIERSESDAENLMLRLRDSTVNAVGERIGIEGYWNTVPAGDIEFELTNTSSGASAIVFSPHSSGGTKTEAMRITSGGNVGIGTTSPAETLHVVGPDSGPIAKFERSGQESVFISGSNGWGNLYTSDSTLAFGTGGSSGANSQMVMVGSNVGIGVTSPQHKLDIDGNLFLGKSGESTALTGGPTLTLQGDSALATFKSDNASSGDQVAGIRVFGDGYRSVGMVIGDYDNSDGSMTEDWIFGRQYASNNKAGIMATPENGGDEYVTVQSHSQKQVIIANDSDDIDFLVKGTGGTYLFGEGSTSKVGIGTTSPQTPLHVVGNVMITNTDSDDTVKDSRILGRTYTNNDYNLIYGYADATTNRLYLGGGTGTGEPATDIRFYTAALNADTDASGTEAMRITSAGNVGIGTTSPSQKLEVNGSVMIPASERIYFKSTDTYIGSDNDSSEDLHIGADGHIELEADGDVIIEVGSTEYVRFDGSTQRVGIGTSSPSEKLHVSGNVKSTGVFVDKNSRIVGASSQVLDVQWTIGTGSDTNGYFDFVQNGSTNENSRVWGDTPSPYYPQRGILWQMTNMDAGGGDGGWVTDAFPVDHTRTYRFSVFARQESPQSGSGSMTMYFGTHGYGSTDGVVHIDNDSVSTNPYFWAGDLPETGKWYLLVGHVLGSGDTAPDTNIYGGIYDVDTGKKEANITDSFRWHTDTTTAKHRSFLFYYDDTGNTDPDGYLFGPRVDLCDGTEPPISSLINGGYFYSTKESTIVTIANDNASADADATLRLLSQQSSDTWTDLTEDTYGNFEITGGASTRRSIMKMTDHDTTTGTLEFNREHFDWDTKIYADSATPAIMVDGSTDRVGIFTASPSTAFHVVGDSTLDGHAEMTNNKILRWQDSDGNVAFKQILQSDDNFVMYSANAANNADAAVFSCISDSDTHNMNIGPPNNRLVIDDANNNVSLKTNGTEQVRITSAGNVGIGTDTPPDELTVEDSASPVLGIYRNTNVASLSAGDVLSTISFRKHTGNSGNETIRLYNVQGDSGSSGASDDYHTSDLRISTRKIGTNSYTDRFTILGQEGYVGIGTTSPEVLLHVKGDTYIQSATANQLLRIHADTNSSPAPRIELMRGAHDTWGTGDNYCDWRIVNENHLTYYSGFSTQSSGAAVERLKLYSDATGLEINNAFIIPGSIGSAGQVLKVPSSGTTLEWAADGGDIDTDLNLAGNPTWTVTSTSGIGLNITRDKAAASMDNDLVRIRDDNSGSDQAVLRLIHDGFDQMQAADHSKVTGALVAQSTDDTIQWPVTVANAKNANSDGYGVGIKLKLSGWGNEDETDKWAGIGARGDDSSSWGRPTGMMFWTRSSTTSGTTPTEKMYLDGGGQLGIGVTAPSHIIHVDGQGRATNSAWATSSDMRVKENIVELDSSLDVINSLRPVKFDYIDGAKDQINFIAQEFKEVIPDAVTLTEEQGLDDFHVLDTSMLVPMLVKAVQELTAKVEELEARLDG